MARTRMILAALLVAAAAAVPAGAQAPLPAATALRVDSLFARFSRESPGCALGVFEGGGIVYERGYGSANLEDGAPITPRAPFIMGSVSKQFTAAAIALLADEGRLSLDDDVRTYVPELPDYGTRITIDELVHHTSGIRDFWALVDAAGMRFDDGYTVADVVRLAARQRRLNFTPGTQYNYSNTGYVLLGVVVQRVTGMSLRQFAANRIFGPLAMVDSHYHDDHTEPVRGRAIAYAPREGKLGAWRIDVWNNDIVGQGGVMTTVEDLQKWDENFYTGRVGGRALLARQLTRGTLADGTTLAYAFGLEIGEYRGLPTVEHSGSTGGYRTDLLRFPGEHATVTTLCNATTIDAVALAHRVADVVLASRFTKPVPASSRAAAAQSAAAITVPTPALAALAGRYHSPELDASYDVTPGAGGLIVRRPRGEVDTLRATEPGLFRTRGYSLRVVSEPSSKSPVLSLDNGRVRGVEFEREP